MWGPIASSIAHAGIDNFFPVGLANSKAGLEISFRLQSQERSNRSSISELHTKENLTTYRDLAFSIVENQREPTNV
jgi:hypothetical protein